MQTVRFVRDSGPFESTTPYKAGQVVDLPPDQVARWIRRNAIEIVEPAPRGRRAAAAAPPAAPTPDDAAAPAQPDPANSPQ